MNARSVIIRPIVREKSYALLAANKYTFRVHPDAHKTQIRQAVEEIFGVRVQDVRTMNVKLEAEAPRPDRRPHARVEEGVVAAASEDDTIELFEGQELGE